MRWNPERTERSAEMLTGGSCNLNENGLVTSRPTLWKRTKKLVSCRLAGSGTNL